MQSGTCILPTCLCNRTAANKLSAIDSYHMHSLIFDCALNRCLKQLFLVELQQCLFWLIALYSICESVIRGVLQFFYVYLKYKRYKDASCIYPLCNRQLSLWFNCIGLIFRIFLNLSMPNGSQTRIEFIG